MGKTMAKTLTLTIKTGEVEIVSFGQGSKSFVILPGLSYEGFFGFAEQMRAFSSQEKAGRSEDTVLRSC